MTEELVLFLFVPAVLLVFVALAAILQFAEGRSPRFKAWLDRNWPDDRIWK